MIYQSWFLSKKYTKTGLEVIERLRFLASFPLPDTGKREGGEKMQPFNRFASHPVKIKNHVMSHFFKTEYDLELELSIVSIFTA